jgi:hypothetical protein
MKHDMAQKNPNLFPGLRTPSSAEVAHTNALRAAKRSKQPNGELLSIQEIALQRQLARLEQLFMQLHEVLDGDRSNEKDTREIRSAILANSLNATASHAKALQAVRDLLKTSAGEKLAMEIASDTEEAERFENHIEALQRVLDALERRETGETIEQPLRTIEEEYEGAIGRAKLGSEHDAMRHAAIRRMNDLRPALNELYGARYRQSKNSKTT